MEHLSVLPAMLVDVGSLIHVPLPPSTSANAKPCCDASLAMKCHTTALATQMPSSSELMPSWNSRVGSLFSRCWRSSWCLIGATLSTSECMVVTSYSSPCVLVRAESSSSGAPSFLASHLQRWSRIAVRPWCHRCSALSRALIKSSSSDFVLSSSLASLCLSSLP
eukprot:3938072-Rhodomonas_salina.1